MARQRYRSDEKRLKSRPHVKVHLTVASHQRTAAVWADLEMRAMLVELWRLAAEAFAGKTEGRVALSPAALRSITGRERHFTGVSRLRTLCSRMAYEMVTEGSATFVTVRNFASKQGFDSAPRGATPPTPDPSYSECLNPIPNPTTEEEKKEESPAAAGAAPTAAPLFVEPPAKAKRPATERVEPPEAIEFADQFAAAVQGVHPSARPPSPSARREWIREARLMLERDQRPLAELQAVADWLFNSEQSDARFWRRNVLSVPKFREQYVKLDAARRSEHVGPVRQHKPGPLEQAARNILARAAVR